VDLGSTAAVAVFTLIGALGALVAALGAWRTFYVYRRMMEISERALAASARSLELSVRTGVENQRSAAILNFSTRYDELYRFRWEIYSVIGMDLAGDQEKSDTGKMATQRYKDEFLEGGHVFFRRYWGLQADQINHWLVGYVDPDTLLNWLQAVVHHLNSSDRIGTLSYKEGWDQVSDHHRVVNRILYEFVEIMKKWPASEKTSDKLYAKMILFLLEIETNEDDFIRRMSANYENRVTVEIYITTLREDLREAINTERNGFRVH
jgi:hypothetical protein